MIDTEIRLSGKAAHDFNDIMTSIDLESIRARDKFVSELSCQFDEQGILSIDISDLEVELDLLDSDIKEIEAVPVPKNEIYIGAINIQFSKSSDVNVNTLPVEKNVYTADDYYVSERMYSVEHNILIQFAA